MKKYRIYCRNGETLDIYCHDVGVKKNGWTLWNGLKKERTYLSNKYIDRIEEVEE